MTALTLAIVALLWCGYLHYYLYRTIITAHRDAKLLLRLIKLIRQSGILRHKILELGEEDTSHAKPTAEVATKET